MQTYSQTPIDVVRVASGIDFAYRHVGNRGGIPLVLANYFAANRDDWDPPIVEGLTADRDVITFDYAMLRTIQQPTLIVHGTKDVVVDSANTIILEEHLSDATLLILPDASHRAQSQHEFDTQLAGVQQCAAHLIRHAKGVLELHPTQQQWTGQIIDVLREAAAAVAETITDGREQLDPNYWPTCVNATTTRSDGASPPTATAAGPTATTPDTTSPHASTTRPNRSGPSPEASPCRGQTTPASKPSKAPNAIKPSPATGTHSPHLPDTAASAPT
jgi:hypothetical protein